MSNFYAKSCKHVKIDYVMYALLMYNFKNDNVF